MFQIEKFEILQAAGQQTGIQVTFSDNQTVQVLFTEIPVDRTTAASKAEWLKNRLNDLFVVGTKPDGTPLRHYRANVVHTSELPFAVTVSIEAV